MNKVIIVFPPWAGGNHLKNLICVNDENFTKYEKIYNCPGRVAHTSQGPNLNKDIYINSNVLCGHFGEVMSCQDLIKDTQQIKWILISPDSREDREILANRGRTKLELDGYFDLEQVYLYEPFMYANYFKTSMENIMNISVHELFKKNINEVIDRINFFLQKDLNRIYANKLHKLWIEKQNV